VPAVANAAGTANEAAAAVGSVTEPITVNANAPVAQDATAAVRAAENETVTEAGNQGGAKNIFPLSHSKKSRSYKSKTGKKKVIRRNKSRKHRK
jgi:hypothetical protein